MNPRIPIYKNSRTLLYKPVAAAILAGVILAFFGPARAAKSPAPAAVQAAEAVDTAGE